MANIFNINVQQNATFDMSMVLTDSSGSYINVASWSFSASIKSSFKDVVPVTNFTMSVLNPVSGSIELTLSATQTAQLVKPTYHYDVIGKDISTSPPVVYRLVQGTVNNDLGITPPN